MSHNTAQLRLTPWGCQTRSSISCPSKQPYARWHAPSTRFAAGSNALLLDQRYANAVVSDQALREAVRLIQADAKSSLERWRTQQLHELVTELKSRVRFKALPWSIARPRNTGSAARSTDIASSSDRDVVLFLSPRQGAITAAEGSDAWCKQWLDFLTGAYPQLQDVIEEVCGGLSARNPRILQAQVSRVDPTYANWRRICIEGLVDGRPASLQVSRLPSLLQVADNVSFMGPGTILSRAYHCVSP